MAFGQTGAIRTDCYLMLMSSVVLSTGAQTPVPTKTGPTVSERWKPGLLRQQLIDNPYIGLNERKGQ